MRSLTTVLLALALACGSNPPPAPAPGTATALLDTEWRLVTLNRIPAGLGAGGRFATLELSSEDMHVSGFAGCNRMGGRYIMDGNDLRFIQVYTTKMACADGMDLEQEYLAALDATREFRLVNGRLRLLGVPGVLAEFEARP